MTDSPFRCGFVAIAGRPNVGKSTLMNALVAEKVSIVTSRPQTTRHRIAGIRNADDAQIVFLDTPGIHRRKDRAINRAMNRVATSTLADADVVLFVVEALRWTDEDEDVLSRVREARGTVLLVVNKVDRVHPKEKLLPFLAAMSERGTFADLFPVSALKRDNLDPLLAAIVPRLPESPPMYPPDQVSDRGEAFRVSEIIREKLTRRLNQELPYGLTVQVERMASVDGRREIDAVIWVEREAHKAIVIGRGGSLLKECGSAARREIKARLGEPVHLTLWVRVRQNWSDSSSALKDFGYEVP